MLGGRSSRRPHSARDCPPAHVRRGRAKPKPIAAPPTSSTTATSRSSPREVLGNPGIAGPPCVAAPAAAETPKSGGGGPPRPGMGSLWFVCRQVEAGLLGLVLLPLLGPHITEPSLSVVIAFTNDWGYP